MTSFTASNFTNSDLQLIGTDGTTVLETDLDDGTFGIDSATIAGATLASAGTYYLLVTAPGTRQLWPYHLHVRVQSGAPAAEIEPNETYATAQPLPPSGWITGSTSSTTDNDIYSLSLNAGDTIYASLDLDPTRDNTQWNGQLGVAIFGGTLLVINDASVGSPTNPLSEAHFMTVKAAGTYYVRVNLPAGGTTFGDYTLSVAVIPAEAQTCATYTSTNVPVTIPPDPGPPVESTLTVPGNLRIGDLDVSIELNHMSMADLDVTLVSPAGNENGLFTDVGSPSGIVMNLTIDDEAGIPLGLYPVVDGMIHTPEPAHRLDWFDGEDAGGTWTLRIRDDAAARGGTLTAWSLRVCEPTPPCSPSPTVYYSQDFEASDGGYTHSGTQDEWEWGAPSFPPITNCNSGTSCWKTDLNTYNASSTQDLVSIPIDLTAVSPPVNLRWAMKYQMETAEFDHASVDVRQAGGANPTRVWEWLGPTMTTTVGNPTTTIQESAGWGFYNADISAYAGQSIEVRFHLDSDTIVQLGGLAIDDVRVDSCPVPVELMKFQIE